MKLGFKKLQNMLDAGHNPPKDSAALAAYIGRKKYSKGVMQKAAAEHKPIVKKK